MTDQREVALLHILKILKLDDLELRDLLLQLLTIEHLAFSLYLVVHNLNSLGFGKRVYVWQFLAVSLQSESNALRRYDPPEVVCSGLRYRRGFHLLL